MQQRDRTLLNNMNLILPDSCSPQGDHDQSKVLQLKIHDD